MLALTARWPSQPLPCNTIPQPRVKLNIISESSSLGVAGQTTEEKKGRGLPPLRLGEQQQHQLSRGQGSQVSSEEVGDLGGVTIVGGRFVLDPSVPSIFHYLYTESSLRSIQNWFHHSRHQPFRELHLVQVLRRCTGLDDSDILDLFDLFDTDSVGQLSFHSFFLLLLLLAAKESRCLSLFLHLHGSDLHVLLSGSGLHTIQSDDVLRLLAALRLERVGYVTLDNLGWGDKYDLTSDDTKLMLYSVFSGIDESQEGDSLVAGKTPRKSITPRSSTPMKKKALLSNAPASVVVVNNQTTPKSDGYQTIDHTLKIGDTEKDTEHDEDEAITPKSGGCRPRWFTCSLS